MKDERQTYNELGLNLEFIRCYAMKVLCDADNQSLFTKKEFNAKLSRIESILSSMKNELEIKMYNKGYGWADTNVFYGNSDSVKIPIEETKQTITKIAERKINDFSN